HLRLSDEAHRVRGAERRGPRRRRPRWRALPRARALRAHEDELVLELDDVARADLGLADRAVASVEQDTAADVHDVELALARLDAKLNARERRARERRARLVGARALHDGHHALARVVLGRLAAPEDRRAVAEKHLAYVPRLTGEGDDEAEGARV